MNSKIKCLKWTFYLCTTINIFYMRMQTDGFISACKYLYSYTKLEIYKYLFKHWKWFAKYIRNKAKKRDAASIILVELFLADNWNLEDIKSRLPENERAKFTEFYNKLINQNENSETLEI